MKFPPPAPVDLDSKENWRRFGRGDRDVILRLFLNLSIDR